MNEKSQSPVEDALDHMTHTELIHGELLVDRL
jgi:hypothetical protein